MNLEAGREMTSFSPNSSGSGMHVVEMPSKDIVLSVSNLKAEQRIESDTLSVKWLL